MRREFAPADAERVLARLAGLDAYEQDPERLHAAVVLLARGNVIRVEWAFEAAEVDWRDVFVWSGLGDNDWPPRIEAEFGPCTS